MLGTSVGAAVGALDGNVDGADESDGDDRKVTRDAFHELGSTGSEKFKYRRPSPSMSSKNVTSNGGRASFVSLPTFSDPSSNNGWTRFPAESAAVFFSTSIHSPAWTAWRLLRSRAAKSTRA